MLLLLILAFLIPQPDVVKSETDICGRYAILSKTDEFFISQPFTQKIAIDLADYVQVFNSIKPEIIKFEEIANNYSKIEYLKETERYPLIPFTAEKNLIQITGVHSELPELCKQKGAHLLTYEPDEKNRLIEIMKKENMALTPFFGMPVSHSLFSPKFNVLDSPPSAKAKFTNVGQTYFPYLSAADGVVKYAEQTLNFSDKALCSKPNNYWDRIANRKFFIKTLKSILSTIPTIKRITDQVLDLSSILSNLTHSNAQIVTDKYSLTAPNYITKILTFMQNFNSIGNWENSKPEEIAKFLEYKTNFKQMVNTFKSPNAKSNVISNFIQDRNTTIDFAYSDHFRLLTYLGLDPEHFGITGPVRVKPLQSIKVQQQSQEETSTSIFAEISLKIYNRQDIAIFYDVKPLIFNEKITTINHVIKLARHAQASTSKPSATICTTETDEKIKICEGFQTAGIEEPHPSTLLSCGRALLSMNETIDIDTCPSTDAPLEPLAYRAECVPGTKSAILSSIRPLKVKVACDTIDIYSSLFDHFPVVIETECAVNEVGNDTYKTLLPQIQLDFYQNQKVGEISTYRPPVATTTPIPTAQLEPHEMMLIAATGTIFVSIVIILILLAIFDPKRCASKIKSCCSCCCNMLRCCGRCCKKCCCCEICKPDPEIDDIEHTNNKKVKHYYPSPDSIASAPSLDQIQMQPFIPASLSRKSSTNDIRSAGRIQQQQQQQQQTNRVLTR